MLRILTGDYATVKNIIIPFKEIKDGRYGAEALNKKVSRTILFIESDHRIFCQAFILEYIYTTRTPRDKMVYCKIKDAGRFENFDKTKTKNELKQFKNDVLMSCASKWIQTGTETIKISHKMLNKEYFSNIYNINFVFESENSSTRYTDINISIQIRIKYDKNKNKLKFYANKHNRFIIFNEKTNDIEYNELPIEFQNNAFGVFANLFQIGKTISDIFKGRI